MTAKILQLCGVAGPANGEPLPATKHDTASGTAPRLSFDEYREKRNDLRAEAAGALCGMADFARRNRQCDAVVVDQLIAMADKYQRGVAELDGLEVVCLDAACPIIGLHNTDECKEPRKARGKYEST